MTAVIIDGVASASKIRVSVAEGTRAWVEAGHARPGLATVLVGEDPASQVYVRSKQKACAEVGIESYGHALPATVSQKDLEALVADLNADPKVNGILVQLPLPKGLDEEKVLRSIRIEKDVDGSAKTAISFSDTVFTLDNGFYRDFCIQIVSNSFPFFTPTRSNRPR